MSDETNVTAEESQTSANAEGQVDDKGTGNEDTQSVDELLNEFDQETSSNDTSTEESASGESEQEAPGTNDIDNNPEFREMQKHFAAQRQAQTETDLNNAADTLRDSHEALKGLPKRVLRGVLQDKANDPRFVNAFVNRGSNPNNWGKVLKAVGRELGDEFKKAPDSNLTDDMSSLRSAVKSADSAKSSDGPSDKELLGMNDSDFNEHLSKQGFGDASGWG